MLDNLPVIQCDKNCGECCGPVLCQEWEFKQVKNYVEKNNIKPVEQGEICPFYQDGKCKVYPVRPHSCRLFGHCEGLTCCKGYNVNIPKDQEDRIMSLYLDQGTPTRYLHEILPDGLKILATSVRRM
jgi:Fe-S-cluster containining protein